MSLVKSGEIPALFLELAEKLRAMGATRVEAFGCVVCFGPVPVANEPARPREEPAKPLSAEAQELQKRAQKWVGGT